jgi:hypothetical protein
MLEGRKQQIKVFALNLGADDEKSCEMQDAGVRLDKWGYEPLHL